MKICHGKMYHCFLVNVDMEYVSQYIKSSLNEACFKYYDFFLYVWFIYCYSVNCIGKESGLKLNLN
jgi:hypothetical protein